MKRLESSRVVGWRAFVVHRLLVLATVMSVFSMVPVWFGFPAGWAKVVLHGTQLAVVVALLAALRSPRGSQGRGAVVVVAFLVVGAMGTSVAGLLAAPATAFALAVVLAGFLRGRAGAAAATLLVLTLSMTVALAMTSGLLPVPDAVITSPLRLTTWLRSLSISILILAVIGGLVAWVVEHLEDVSAQLEVEAELRRDAEQRNHEAQRDQLIGQLAAGLAHDVNNHLGVISMWSSLAHANEARIQDAAVAIQASVDQAAGLTGQLLLLSRRDVRQLERLSLSDLVTRFQRTVARTLPEGVTVEVVVQPDLWVMADESQLQQLILNVSLNACDAMPEGGLLRVTLRRDAPPDRLEHASAMGGEWVVLEVSDAGVGMDADTLERATDVFFTTKPRGSGTGLGLATAKRIAEASDGAFLIDSTVGVGTTVRLYLPVVEPAEDTPEAVAPRVVRSLEGKRILLVDDVGSVLRALISVLDGTGAQIVTAGSGDEALRRVEEGDFDLLCTDAVMPGASVGAVMSAFRAANPGAPVVICSGYVESELLRRGVEAGEVRFLHKPFTATELVDTLCSELAGAGERPPPAEP